MVGKLGWVIDFDRADDAGERVVNSGLVVNARLLGTVVEMPSIIPTDSNDPCTMGGRGYINFVDAFSGAAVTFNFMDINGDGVLSEDDAARKAVLDSKGAVKSPSIWASSYDTGRGMPGNLPTLVGNQNVNGGTFGGVASQLKNLSGNSMRGRISWREVVGG